MKNVINEETQSGIFKRLGQYLGAGKSKNSVVPTNTTPAAEPATSTTPAAATNATAPAAPATPAAPVSIKKIAQEEDLQSFFLDQYRTKMSDKLKQLIGKKIVTTPPPPQDELSVVTLKKILIDAGVKEQHADAFIKATTNKELVAEWVNMIDSKRLLSESTTNRWKVLANIK